MNPNCRMYAIPYNGTDPAWFLQETEKRKAHIDHVYCELPLGREGLVSHIRFLFEGHEAAASAKEQEIRERYLANCAEFLRISKGRVRRVCPVNAMYYHFRTEQEIKDFVITVARTAVQYQLEGLILSDYRVAVLMHALLPELEIQTSCNGYQWNLRQMEIWRDKCGATVFNPPREILRTPSQLKEMHAAGFALKCLINEACLVGCPNSFNHQLSISLHCKGQMLSCCQSGIGDLFRGNWILPRWQKYFDEYVAIYKISGRNAEGNYPFMTLDAYLTENNEMRLTELMLSGTVGFARRMVPAEALQQITLDKVPDKLLTCACRDCARCGLCDSILRTLVPEAYWERFRFKVNVLKNQPGA